MSALTMDVKLGLRALLQNKLVTALAVVSLAMAIAGNSTIFSVISSLLLRPLPFDEPDRMLFVADSDPNALGISLDSSSNFLDLQERLTSFEFFAAFQARSIGLLTDGEPEAVTVLAASAHLFDVMGYRPLLGRTFIAEDDLPGSNRVAVLSHGFWMSHFGGDAAALGETINLSEEIYTIVGIMGQGSDFLDPTLEMYIPLAIDRAAPGPRDVATLSIFGRLAPGVTFEAANIEVDTVSAQLETEYPRTNRGHRLRVMPVMERLVSPPNRRIFLVLQIGLLFVLVIATVNVANLLLARGQERERELATRAALGAGRGRIVRQLFTESLVLASCGGLLGLVLSAVGIRILVLSMAGRLPPGFAPSLDGPVLAFMAALAVLSALVFGLVPALRSSRVSVVQSLRDGGRGSSGGVERRLIAKSLVVAQVAMALVLLCGAAVLLGAFDVLQYSSPGFETTSLLTVGLNPPATRYDDGAEVARYFEQVAERVAGLPSVSQASFVLLLPRSPFNAQRSYTIDGVEAPPDGLDPKAIWLAMSPTYHDTLGVPMLEGRPFSSIDRGDSPQVAIVNRAFARRHWPQGGAVGERITMADESREIVGVVTDVWQELLAGEGGRSPVIYLPHAQQPVRSMALLARTTGEPSAVVEALRAAIWDVDARVPVDQILTFEEYVDQFFGTEVIVPIVRILSTLALLLAAVGIYGVVAFSVGRRTHEIGLRVAMGARYGDILRLIGREGVILLTIGLTLGVPGVYVTTLLVGQALQGLVGVDATMMAPVAALLVLVTGLACYLPARRAATLEPVEALRYE